MSKIRCLLVDDEPPALELLEKYTSMIDQLEVVGTALSAVKAFDMLNDVEVDLMFLDIRMPVLNGIDFIKSLKHPPAVILTTAYREYALDGYDLDIIDYLLKPIAFDRFLKAVDRYRDRSITPSIIKTKKPEHSKSILFNINRTKYKVNLDDILYIESLKDYTRIHTIKDKLVVKGNIGSILKQLPGGQFIRIHRSFIIAPSHISNYNQTEVDIRGSKIPSGNSYRDIKLDRFA